MPPSAAACDWPKQGAAVGLAEEADLEELIRQKEALAAERDGQVQAIVALRGEVRRRGRRGGGSMGEGGVPF